MNVHHYAVVVGINRYPGLSDLQGARGDAEAFAQWLESPDGGRVPPANVMRVMAKEDEEAVYVDPGDAKPVREQIEDALAEAARSVRSAVQEDRDAWLQSRLYLYVAGHGLAPSSGEGALYMANAREGASRHLELAEYREWCTRCAYFREVIVFADCCRTRKSTVRALPPTLDECGEPFDKRKTTWVVGFGSGLGEPTYEDELRGHFTIALIDGLKNAKPDETGAITAATLAPYVATAVAERTKGKRHPQTAEVWFDGATRVIFGTRPSSRRAVHRVVISFPPGYAGVVELHDHALQLVGMYDASAGPWSLWLDEGFYKVAPAAGQPPAVFANDGHFSVVEENTDVPL